MSPGTTTAPVDQVLPVVSVIIPVLNEKERLRANLESLLGQVNSPRYEMIYVDDCSTDGSWQELNELAEANENIRLIRLDSPRSVGAVRALAVTLARGAIIANLDADCEADKEWLSRSSMLTDSVGVLGFPVFPPSDLEYLHWRFQYAGTGQYGAASLPHGCGALMRKDLVLRAGNFPDTSLGEDTRLFRAIEMLGSRILILNHPTIRLLQKRRTLGDHLHRYYRMGRNANAKSRRIYAVVLSALALDVAVSLTLWRSAPAVSMVLLIAIIGLLANPKRIWFYVTNFRLPENAFAKVVIFSCVKILETTALLAGFISAPWQRKVTGLKPKSTTALRPF